MDKKTVLLSLILLILVSAVHASNLTFRDAAYLGNGTLSVSDPLGNQVTALNDSESIEISNNTPSMLDYNPGGLYALHQEQIFSWNDGNWTGPDFGAMNFYIQWFMVPGNLLMFLWICLLVLVVIIA
jgi:hypothetical protein